jgi:hypothetical protein
MYILGKDSEKAPPGRRETESQGAKTRQEGSKDGEKAALAERDLCSQNEQPTHTINWL